MRSSPALILEARLCSVGVWSFDAEQLHGVLQTAQSCPHPPWLCRCPVSLHLSHCVYFPLFAVFHSPSLFQHFYLPSLSVSLSLPHPPPLSLPACLFSLSPFVCMPSHSMCPKGFHHVSGHRWGLAPVTTCLSCLAHRWFSWDVVHGAGRRM